MKAWLRQALLPPASQTRKAMRIGEYICMGKRAGGILLAAFTLCCMPAAAWQKFFNLTAEEVEIDSLLPLFSYAIPLGTNYADTVYTVKIKYPEFIDMSSADIERYNSIENTLPPEMPDVRTDIVVERKRGILVVSFVPIVYKEKKYQKLVSFMIDVKSKARSAKIRRIAAQTRSTSSERYAEHSVLAEGTWAKIRVPETGVYELTEAVAKSAGFSDLSKVHIYGYGGALQNETLVGDELSETDDLSEVATCTVDGKRLFHAVGPVSWSSATATERTRNPYSDYGYYFITEDDAEPLTMDSAEFIASFYPANDDYHALHEVDDYAWYEGGRNLFESSSIASGSSGTYSIETSGYDATGTIAVAVTAGTASRATIAVNDSVVGTLSITLGSYDSGEEATGVYTVYNLAATNTVTVTATSGGPLRLDYVSAVFGTPYDMPSLATTSFDAPEYVYNITNQDLHADENYQMVIIVPASQELTTQAERLKEFHEEHDGMSVRIVPADELYNEFSSGTPDANAYRRYMKMLYDKAESDEQMPKYLLLFGDCAWDNRMNSSAWANYSPDDFLLCYESENSFSSTSCYVDDGFFGCLDDGEGGDPLTSDKLDIAVGRFPVRDASEAEIMVDKTISYIENENAGSWENTVMFMGDDGNDNQHMIDADEIASELEEINPALYIKRVMWDAYTLVSTATGDTYPEVTDIITEQQESGALMMNYSGHGAEQSLSHEKVLMLDDVKDFRNDNLSFWVAATCDIAPFDGQTENIGEQLVLNDNGGAVAIYGTARTVYVNRNKAMNSAYVKYLFTKDDYGNYISIGEAQRLAKNWLITNKQDLTVNKLQYSLLGDPALVLNIPTLEAVIDSINGSPAGAGTLATLKAGSTATVKGHIERDGGKDTSFTGLVTATVRDSEELVECKLNDTSSDGADEAFTYYDRTNTLFNGTDSVTAGEFSFSFAVPMDINYSGETGLMNIFAVDTGTKDMANGYSEDFTVGGTESTSNDSIGPSIYCYLNTSSFTNGDDVNATPYFYATVTDRDGINTTGAGIGHDMVLIIDGEMSKTYVLNDNFTYDFGSYTSGSTYYNIPELDEGEHSLKFRAWDILNNSSSVELSFNVVKGLTPTLFSVGVTENPASSTTTFIINHDRTGSDMDIEIDVFDTSGRILWKHTETAVPTSSAYTIEWDLTTETGYTLQTGVYLYRVYISSDSGGRASKTKKLIVINNK